MVTWQRLKQNPDLWQVVRQRAWLLEQIRQFFRQNGFLEVSTPRLAPSLIPESYLHIFRTQLTDRQGRHWPAFLTPSPELWHKKLLAAGAGNIFEIARSYRNQDLGGHFHNPEFTLLEWYRVQADYQQTMADSQNLFRAIWPETITYQGKTLSLRRWQKISVVQAFQKYAGIDLDLLFDFPGLQQWAQKRRYPATKNWAELYNLIYLQEIEPHLGQKQPTIIYDFPAEFASLAKKNPKDPRFRRRFEIYLFGIELADGYDELINAQEQAQEFQRESQQLPQPHPVDNDFLQALKSGLPPCSGVAVGVDRLLMILTNKTDIKDVLLFAAEEIFPHPNH